MTRRAVGSHVEPVRALLQRVTGAELSISGTNHARIPAGLVILLGVGQDDEESDADWLAAKVAALRIFPDDQDRMNRSLVDAGGAALVVSQFTLFADTKKGNRPSFVRSAPPDPAARLYEYFLERMQALLGAGRVAAGVFGADMQVQLVNDGPVTIMIDSRQRDF